MCSAVDGVRGETWAVASVYTEPALRGRGHARAMMDALVARARAEGAQASTLFSDVPPAIYEYSGYVARPAEDSVFPPAQGEAARGVDALVDAAGELEPYVDDFSIWPTRDQLDWHLERGRTYAAAARARAAAVAGRARRRRRRVLGGRLEAGAAADLCGSTRRTPTRRRRWCGRRATPRRRRGCTRCGCGRSRGRSRVGPISGGDRVRRVGSVPMIAPIADGVRPEMWTQIPRAVWV